ncbi:MAG: helix-turn-helix domain-containing protein [Nocardioides sp.]
MAANVTAAVDSQWMTLQQAAVYIAISVKTVRRMIARGELPAYICGKRGLRVRRNDLDALMRPV